MRESRPYRTNGKIRTRIYFSETRNDLVPFLREYGSDCFLVISGEARNLFPRMSNNSRYVTVDWNADGKDLDQVMEIIDSARNHGVKPGERWILMGNEPLLELGAFAASIYYGGAPVTAVPTTLLSMVDGAIGGKCGINYPGDRFLISSVHVPEHVIIDVGFLSGEREEDLRNGFGEIMRTAFLSSDTKFAEFLSDHAQDIRHRKPQVIIEMVEAAIAIKLSFLERDPEGTGLQQALEFGRRLSWGFTIEDNLRRLHGNAIIWGMSKAIAFGLNAGITDIRFAERAFSLIHLYGYDTSYRIPRNTIAHYFNTPFRCEDGKMIEVVIPRGQGDMVLVKMGPETLAQLIS